MKNYKPIRGILIPFLGLLALLNVNFAFAAASDPVNNIATISFSVGGVAQPTIGSSSAGNSSGAGTATSFVIDRVLNVVVAEVGASSTSVVPGQTGAVLTYTVTNTGNSTQDFLLTAVPLAANTVNATGVQVFVESGANVGYQSAEDTAVFIDELTHLPGVSGTDNQQTVYVVGNIPNTATNGNTGTYDLVAQAAAGGAATTQGVAITNDDNGHISPAGTYSNGATSVLAGTAATNPNGLATVETVFGDAAGGLSSDGAAEAQYNGQHSASDTYAVGAAALTVSKTVSVISDPVNGTSNPKAIPGAIIEYEVTIANAAGAATATGVTIADSLDTEITNGRLVFNATDYNGTNLSGAACALDPCGMQVTAPTINGGLPQNITNANDADAGSFGITNANELSLNAGNLAAGETATFRFRVTVQ